MSDLGPLNSLRIAGPAAVPRLAAEAQALAGLTATGLALRYRIELRQSHLAHPVPADLCRGSGLLAGRVQAVDETPLTRAVLVIDRAAMQVVRAARSDAGDGRFAFADMAADRRYLVVALDDAPVYNAARIDDVQPA